MKFEYKYPQPRHYYLTKHGTFQVRFCRKTIVSAYGTYKTEDEAYEVALKCRTVL